MQKSMRVLNNIFWGVVNRFCHMLCPFIIRTVILYMMGTLYVGLDGLFLSILGLLSLAELGFGSALTYSMYKPLAEGDDQMVCALLRFYKKCYRIIGCVILAIGLALLPFIKYLIRGEYPADVNIYILYLAYLSNSAASYFLYAYKNSLLTAMQRYDIVNNINSIVYIIQSALQIAILLAFRNYYGYVVLMPIFTAITNLATERYSSKHYPQYQCRGILPASVQQDIMTNVKGIIFQKIGGVVLTSVDSIVISMFLGLNILAIYNNYYYIILALFSVSGTLMQSMIPTVGNSCVVESKDKNFGDFKKFNFMYMYIAAWGSSFLLCLYQPFMKLWVGEELMLTFPYVVMFTVYFFIYKWMDMLHVYTQATGIWWQTRYIPLIAAAVNLTFNIILVKIIGLPGVIISTIISILFIYNLGYLIAMLKLYFNKVNLLPRMILRQMYYLSVVVISSGLTYYIAALFGGEGVIGVIWRVVVCLTVPNIVMPLLFCRLAEFNAAKGFCAAVLKNFIGRKTNVTRS